jgi:hypothetical protein
MHTKTKTVVVKAIILELTEARDALRAAYVAKPPALKGRKLAGAPPRRLWKRARRRRLGSWITPAAL